MHDQLRSDLDEGHLGDVGAGLAREGAARGNNQLYGVLDDNCVVDQVPIVQVLQHRPLHEFAVAVAIAGVWILCKTTC